jgi:hypothetical protein
MNERAHALEVLREAKAILAERLTEQVAEQAEEILADARRLVYERDRVAL